MNSMLINASLLKIPLQLAQKSPASHHALENLIVLRKNPRNIRIHVVQSFPKLKSIKYVTPFCEKYLNSFVTNHSLLETSRNKNHSHLIITNAQLNIYRNYCQKSIDKYSKLKRSDKTDLQKKDEICGEDCISFKKDKIKKRKKNDTIKEGGISFNVNLNNMVNELSKKMDLKRLHEINKINNFIYKPIDCKSCGSEKKKCSGKPPKSAHQKRSNSSFSLPQRVHPKYEMKKKEFKQESYDEIVHFNPRTELLSICLNKYEEKNSKRPVSFATKGRNTRLEEKTKGPIPLFTLVKCNSGKTRELFDHYSKNIKYRVGTNEAFIKNSETIFTNEKCNNTNGLDCNRSRSEGDIRHGNKSEQFFNHSDSTERLKLYQTKIKDSLAEVPKPVLAKAIYEMLKPLIEQEYLQYKEVKTAIQRLENNLETYFNEIAPNSQNTRSNTKENKFDFPLNKNKIIRDPITYLDIKDPSDSNFCKKDPITSNVISAPSVNNPEIFDPTEYQIVIIAEKCGNNNSKSNNPCAEKLKKKSETDGTCKEKLKTQLCEDENKKDTCDMKDKPCAEKKKPTNQLCDDTKKKDACQKNTKQDSCAKTENQPCGDSKKKDPCRIEIKQDFCKKPANEPCGDTKKKDPYRIELKQDYCKKFKQESSCKDNEKKDPCPKEMKPDTNKNPKQDSKCGSDKKKNLCQKDSKQDLCNSSAKQLSDDPKDKDTSQKEIKHDTRKNSEQENKRGNDESSCEKSCGDACLKAKKNVDLCEAEEAKEKHKDRCKIKVDPCKVEKKNEPCSEEIFKKAKKKDSCGALEEGPRDETCKKVVPCCEKASISQEPSLPSIIKPKSSESQSKKESHKAKPQMKSHEVKPQISKQELEKPLPCCPQRSCTQKSMEPTEPPNCCKPLGRRGFEDKPCTDASHLHKVIPDVKQICCEELIKKEREVAEALEKQCAAARSKPPPPPPKKVEPPPPKCDPPSKTETRYCTKPKPKVEVSNPKPVTCTKVPVPPVPQKIKPKPTREPKQALKDSWFPVKMKTQKPQPKLCDCKPKKYSSIKKHIAPTPLPSRTPKLTAQLPKQEPPKKNLLDNCKGLFSSICKVFCPGKNKSGKKGASFSTAISNSLPEPKGNIGGLPCSAPPGSSGNKPKKKPGTVTFAIYRRNRKYPWNTAQRERFFSKSSKEKSDPCKSKKSGDSEQDDAAANKLQCVCYEEVNKKQAQKEKTGGSKSGDHCKKKFAKQLNFKPTNHSKICKMESKKKSGSSKCKTDSKKAGQSLFEQCGELCKGNKNGNDNTSTKKTDSSDTSTVKESKNVCAKKLKTSSSSTKDKSKSTCTNKPTSDTKLKDGTKERKTFKERCNLKSKSKQKKRDQKSKEVCKDVKPKEKQATIDGQKRVSKHPCADRFSPTKSSCKSDIRSKYPWKKSDEKIDGELCANESHITKKSIENEKSKPKNEEDCVRTGKKNMLKDETDSSCFQEFNKFSKEKKGEIGSEQKSETKDAGKQVPIKPDGNKIIKDEKLKTENEKDCGEAGTRNMLKVETDSSCFQKFNKNTKRTEGGISPEQKFEYKDVGKQESIKPDGNKIIKDAEKKELQSSKNDEEKCKQKKEENKNAKEACAQPKPCEIKNKPDEDKNKRDQKITCQDKMKQSQDIKEKKKCSNDEKTAENRESICERVKKNKKGSGKECFMPKKSEKEKPKGVCEKIKEKKKSTEGKGQSISTKTCIGTTKASNDNINKMRNMEDIALDEGGDDMFICKVKSLGKSEQLISSSESEKFQQMKSKDEGVLRILKCKLAKDEFGRDVFLCKEIKPDKDKNEIIQDELQQMKDLLKQRSEPNLSQKRTVVSKKLVCHEESDGEKVCNIETVKEVIEGGKSKQKPCVNSGPKKCPFSYQDLLKRSEQIRKTASDRTLSERNKKTKYVKRVVSTPKVKPSKKVEKCED